MTLMAPLPGTVFPKASVVLSITDAAGATRFLATNAPPPTAGSAAKSLAIAALKPAERIQSSFLTSNWSVRDFDTWNMRYASAELGNGKRRLLYERFAVLFMARTKNAWPEASYESLFRQTDATICDVTALSAKCTGQEQKKSDANVLLELTGKINLPLKHRSYSVEEFKKDTQQAMSEAFLLALLDKGGPIPVTTKEGKVEKYEPIKYKSDEWGHKDHFRIYRNFLTICLTETMFEFDRAATDRAATALILILGKLPKDVPLTDLNEAELDKIKDDIKATFPEESLEYKHLWGAIIAHFLLRIPARPVLSDETDL